MKIPPFLNKKNVSISVSIVGDREMRELNKKHLNKDIPTDVLSFNIDQEDDTAAGAYYLGDVVVNVDQAKRQAKDYENSLEEEISELVAHGVLHLLGVHHEVDK